MTDPFEIAVDLLSEDARTVLLRIFTLDRPTLTVAEVAEELGWEPRRAYRAMKEAEARGLIEGMTIGR